MVEKDNPLGSNLNTLLEEGFAHFMSPLEIFIRKQMTSSILLLVFAFLSLVIANTPWDTISQKIYDAELGLLAGSRHFSMTFGEWISQGLMALFFFLVGLEIKREILAGKLRDIREVGLVVFAALGGIVVPVLFYSLINYGGPGQHGWGIPTATDTALAIGVLAMMARRVSIGVTIFLTALSVFDDIGAVFIISIFYAQDIDMQALGLALLVLTTIFLANRLGVRHGLVYMVLGLFLWILIYRSGIHATCAGLLLAAMIPARASISQHGFIHNVQNLIHKLKLKQGHGIKMLESSGQHSIVSDIGKNVQAASTPLQRWEGSFATPIAIVVLPLFALFNAGIAFHPDLFLHGIQSPVALGIVLALVVGKPLGVLLFVWAGLKFKIGKLPTGMTINEIIGMALLTGIGFTMSVFFTTLSFPSDNDLVEVAKLGILAASLLSAAAGSTWIYWKSPLLQTTS